MVKAIIQWIKGDKGDPATLTPTYKKMFAKNDYWVKVGGNSSM